MDNLLFRFFHRMIFSIFILILSTVLVLNIFFSRGFHSTELPTPATFNVITLVLAAAIFISIYKMRFHIREIISKIPSVYAVPFLLLISVSLQIIVVKYLNVNPSWDFGEIIKNAQILLNGGELDEYFTKYPNNLFIVCILVLVGKFFSSTLLIYQCFNIAVFLISEFLVYRIATKLAGNTVGIISLITSVFFFPYIFYAPIVYTDTISLPFLLLSLNILIKKDGSFKSTIPSILVASLIFSLGVLLKGSLIIFLIALSIVIFIFFRKWKKLLLVLPFLIFFLVHSAFNLFIYNNGIVDQQKVEKYSFPVTHWIMMAQNKNKFGKYASEDVIWTDKLLKTTTREETKRIEINELKKRILEKGLMGNLKFNLEKLNHTWTDGTYYSLNKLKRFPVHPENYQRLIDSNSGYVVQGFARIQHILLLTGLILFAFRMKKKNEFFTFYMLSFVGFFFFFLIWEARSRYLVSLTPLLILISCTGYFGFLTNQKIIFKNKSNSNFEI